MGEKNSSNENKVIWKGPKLGIAIFIVFIIFICIVTFGIYIFNKAAVYDESENTGKSDYLQSDIKNITEEKAISSNTSNDVKDSDTITNSSTNTTEIENEIKEKLDDTKGNELYKKAIFSKKFLALLIEEKDFMEKTFSDKEIAKLLVEFDDEGIFKDASDSNGFYVSAKIDDVQKLSKEYFGKELNTEKLDTRNDDTIIVEIQSGFGIIEDKFIAGYKLDNGDYLLTLEQVNEDSSGSLTYGLFIEYDDTTDSIIYKGFTNDLISYVGKFYSSENN